MARRYQVPPGAHRVDVGFEHEDASFTVVGYLTPGSPGRGPSLSGPGEPPEPAEFCPLAVVEDGTGVERPELLPVVEAALDRLTDEAVEQDRDAEDAAAEDAADARRDEARLC
jgi:hypothetical protein